MISAWWAYDVPHMHTGKRAVERRGEIVNKMTDPTHSGVCRAVREHRVDGCAKILESDLRS